MPKTGHSEEPIAHSMAIESRLRSRKWLRSEEPRYRLVPIMAANSQVRRWTRGAIVDRFGWRRLTSDSRQAASFRYCRSNSISEYGCLMNRSEEECCGQPCSYHEVR